MLLKPFLLEDEIWTIYFHWPILNKLKLGEKNPSTCLSSFHFSQQFKMWNVKSED